MIKQIGALLRKTAYRLSHQTYTREENPYPTIIPPLVVLAYLLKPRSILEFGSGFVSTSLFLDQAVFTDVERLVTCENDPAWIDRIEDKLTDPRATLVAAERPMHEIAVGLDVDSFDLILIDDSFTWGERTDTIQAVMQKRSETSVVAIHDFDVSVYRDAVRGQTVHQAIFSAVSPHTGIVWDTAPLSKKQLRLIDRALFTQRQTVDLTRPTTVKDFIDSLLS